MEILLTPLSSTDGFQVVKISLDRLHHNLLVVNNVVSQSLPSVSTDGSIILESSRKTDTDLSSSLLHHLVGLDLTDLKEQVEVEVCAVICYQVSEEPLWIVLLERQRGSAENTDDGVRRVFWPVGILDNRDYNSNDSLVNKPFLTCTNNSNHHFLTTFYIIFFQL